LPENLGEAPLYEPEKKRAKPKSNGNKKRFNPKGKGKPHFKNKRE